MKLQDFRQQIPQLNGLSDADALDILHKNYYPTVDKQRMADVLGVSMAKPVAPASGRTVLQTMGDLAITGVKGAIGLTEIPVGLANIVTGGAAGKLAEELGYRPEEAKAMLDGAYSDPQKEAFARVQQADGFMGKLSAAVENPSVIAHTVAESVPSMLAGGVAARGLMGVGAAGGAAPGVMARAFGQSAPLAAGAAGEGLMGMGSAAEQIRQQTPDGYLTGEQSGLAAATGAATSLFGVLGGKIAQRLGVGDVDTMLAGAARDPAMRKGVVRSFLEGAATEGVLEELPQSISEQVLQNMALGKPLDEGVDQAAALGLLAGGAMGGGAGALGTFGRTPEADPVADAAKTQADAIRATKPQGDGPLSKAVGAGIEAEAQKVEAAPVLGARLSNTPMANMLGGAGMTGTDPLAGMLSADRQQEENTAVRMGAFVDRNQSMLTGGGLAGNADPVANMIAGARESDATSETNIRNFAQSRAPMVASDAARILDEAKTRGMDFTAAPHPEGGFMVVPRQWVTPSVGQRAEAEIADTLTRMAQADAAPVDRAPRARAEAVDLTLPTVDPVRDYVDGLRKVNTPAAKFYVGEFDAGRITPADVQQRMTVERGKTPDERLADAAAQAPKNTAQPGDLLNPKGEPFKTLMSARLAAKKTPGDVIEVVGGYSVRPKTEVTSAQAAPVPAGQPQADAGAAQAPVKKEAQPQAMRIVVRRDITGDEFEVQGSGANGSWEKQTTFRTSDAANDFLKSWGHDVEAVETLVSEWSPKSKRFSPPKHQEPTTPAQAEPVAAAVAGQPEQAQPLSPETSRKLQESHKALGYGVTRPQVQSMRDRVAQEVETGTTNNGGVVVALKPAAINKRREQLQRLDADLALFDGQPSNDGAPVAAEAVVKESLTADGIARALTDSIGRNAIKNNDKYWDEQVKKGYAAPDRAETGKRQARETWVNSKVSERTQKLATAIADKDPRPLVEAWAKEGQGTSGSEGSMDGFKELTGINLKKLNSAARAKAIYDWAGWDDSRVAADVAKRTQATSQRKAEQAAKEQADADSRSDRVASAAPLATKDGKQIGTVKSWVDDLVGQGFTELRQIKKGAITKTFLTNPATGAGYPMPTGLLREYADVATRRAKAAPAKPDMGNPTSTQTDAGNPVSAIEAEIPATTPAESVEAAPPEARPAEAEPEGPADFIPSPDGGLDYGEITPDMGKAMRRQAGKIRLQRGNETFGLQHIEARHGDEIRAAGFTSVAEFVAGAVSEIDSVWKPAATSQLVVIQATERGRVVFIQLQAGKDESGDFYTVKTAFPSSRTYAEKRKEWEKLWSRVPVPAADAGTSAPSAEPENIAGLKSAMDSGQSQEVSLLPTSAPAQAEAPKLTQTEAADLMEWVALGTKDGVTKHVLGFYESKADKDAKRGRMSMATITKGDRSLTGWMVDGDDQKFGPLALAKKRGMEIGMAKAVADGFVQRTDGRETVNTANDKQIGTDINGKPVYEGTDGALKGVPYTFDERGKVRTGVAMAGEVAAKPEPKKSEQTTDDRDKFTLSRLSRETGQMEPVTFQRGEYVEFTLVGSGKKDFGEIDGISQARREFSVDGLWYPMGAAYKAERPTTPERKDTVPLSAAIDRVNAKYGKGLTDADRVPEQKPASKTPAMDAHAALMDAVRSGKATPEQFKAGFEAVVAGVDAIKAELGTHTKPDLLKMGGPYMRMRYASENKPEIIDALYREMLGEFTLGESFSYGMAKDSYRNAIRRMVDATDADKLAKYVAERKAAIEEATARRVAAVQAVADPKTLDDFKAAVRAAMLDGKTRKEAYLTLTPEQRVRFDELDAEGTREARETRKRAQKTQVQAAGQTTGGQIIATKHTRDGYDLFVVQLSDRLSKEDYSTVLASAKRMGGWYSAFRGNGATPGFQFKEKASAEAFLKLAGGDTTAAQDQAAQRRDAFEDDRSQTAAERLTEMADRLEAQADEELGRDRKANTARRARFAASAEAAASNVKALAKTMRNIATAIGDGKAKFLDAVRQKTQVEMLAGVVHTAKYNELVARFPEYADREKRKGEPPTIGTADFAEFPTFTAFRSDLASLARQMLEVDGTKKLGQQLMGVADDVTDAYLDFAKKNLHLVSTFKLKDGSGAIFSSKETGANAIRRSGLTGKAILLPVKRGENVVVMSPSEAMNRGVWKGDGDKRITLTKDAGMELVQAIGRKGNQSNGLKVPWQFETAADRLKALSRMGIETPAEFRSAVREFISLRVQAQEADRVKAMERAMVGRKADGLDFFPTPAEVADQMVEAAGIEPDMAVLEPSAGMGHLADRIRAAGAEPDVVELSGDRRELLEEKGFTVVGTDFMQMKPRTFFTYGDVFRAPDGKEGVMRGQGGMGSDRVRLVDDTGNILGYYSRDELTGVRHGGTESGYDRIIMNPPFGDRRDAEHVRHAYSLLKPGGRLVAIMGEGVFFGKDKKAEDFREWLDTLGGTSEKLPEGSFMDPSLPVTTGVNARMVVVEKPAGAALFSQNLLSQKLGPKPTLEQIERFVQRVQDVAKNVLPVTVVGNPAQINVLDVPAGSSPSGALIDGRIYLFADNIKSGGDAYSTLFHEIFHLGLQKVIPAEAYSSLLKQFAASPLVARYVRQWTQSPEGVEKAGTMPSQAYDALATEEALAMVSETLAADQNIGSVKLPGLVKRMLAWFAQVADQLGFPVNFGNWMRGLTQTAAERFVSDMTRAVLGGDKNLAKTQAKYGTQAAQLSSQNRLRAGGEADGVRFRQSSEALNGAESFSVKDATADQLAHYRGMGMQVLGRRQIVDLYGEMLPELKQYDTLVQRMDADKNESGAEADALVSDWAKLDERGPLGMGLAKHPGMERKLAELMHDATLAQIDPAKPLQRGDDPGAHKTLVAKFEALSPKAQEVYRTARDMYANHFKKVQAAIQDRIQRSGMDETSKAKMIAKMDADLFNKLKGVYFPLARFGKYVVVSKNAAGETVSVSRAETLGEANKMRREVVKNSPPGVTVSRVYKDAEFNASRDAVGKGFVSDLMTMLQGQGVGEDVLDSVGQLYLSSLPDLSWAKHGIHRKGTPGFSQDARRAFAQNMFHGARHLAKLRYSDQLADKLMDMEERVKDQRDNEGFDPIKAQQVVDEMNARHETLMNPKASSLSTALTSVGFVWFLGISPASALVNLSQTALVAYPVMAAKWGFQKAGTALLSASAEVVRAGNDLSKVLKGDELAAFQKAVDDGTIDVTQAHDLAGVAQGEDERVAMAMRPVMRAASFMFHHAEKFNRQATFIAAYRLAKESGADADLAFEQAKKATYDGHFDYSASNRPRLMQGNWQKVLFLFKQYGQNMVYTLTRQAYLSMKGMTPQQRTEARKQLGGLLAMHAMAAGALGLPLVGVLLSAASMLGSDDDEPWDAEVAMKNMMADAMGPKAAEVMAHGLSRLTPWDLSGRVALNKLILPDIQEGLEGQPLWEKMVTAAAGPVAGIGQGIFKGMAEMGQGQYQRGLESMLPVALKNPVKAMRFGEEGVVDKTGVVIKDEVGMAGVLGQASGFRPSEVALATEGRTAIYQANKALTERRSSIMRLYAQARMTGDTDGVKDAMAMVQSFNAKNPARRIVMRDLIQSVRGRNRRIEQAEQGVYLPKTQRDALAAGRFALAE